MIFEQIRSNEEINDIEFDLMYPIKLKDAIEMHFTPIEVAKTAARYLAHKKGVKVLDIGSGAGKFCMIGSACTEGSFTGVELRESLFATALRISKRYNLLNIEFVHANITDIPFKDFDAFYFFNAFYENVSRLGVGKINNELDLSRELYDTYSFYVKQQLDEMPVGTKLVTYFSFSKEVPDSYHLQFTDFDGKLKMWEKVS
jgi:Methyltransferase domain